MVIIPILGVTECLPIPEIKISICPPSGALGSLIMDELVIQSNDKRMESLTILILTLQDTINKYVAGRTIDYISMDIEGMELPVLESIDFSLIFQIVFCIETTHYSKNRKKEKIMEFLCVRMFGIIDYVSI